MVAERYKKWALVIIAVAVTIFMVVLFSTRTPHQKATVKSRDEGPGITRGPIVDTGKMKILSVGELGLDTDDPQSLALAGDRYFENRQYEQAIVIYRKVLELNPSDVDTHNDLGLALFYTGKAQEAIEILKKGTGVDPNYQRIWLSLGFVMISTGKIDDAREALIRARDLDPDSIIGKEAVKMLTSAGS
jgi:tetratricopeptide (TPR) repeat protein